MTGLETIDIHIAVKQGITVPLFDIVVAKLNL